MESEAANAVVAAGPHGLEITAWAATIVLAVTAALGLGYTARLLYLADLQRRASVLLDLDNRWDSSGMIAARLEMVKLMAEIDAEAERDFEHLTPAEIKERSRDMFAQRLADMDRKGDATYPTLTNMLSFFETVGYVAKRGYLPTRDVIDLFGSAILSTDRVFGRHIAKRQALPATTGRVYEYTVWLIGEMKKTFDRRPGG